MIYKSYIIRGTCNLQAITGRFNWKTQNHTHSVIDKWDY